MNRITIGHFELAVATAWGVVPVAFGIKVPLVGRLICDSAGVAADRWAVAKREALTIC